MVRLRERLSARYMALIVAGATGAAAGVPLMHVAIAWGSPTLLAIPILGIIAMTVGFAVAPRDVAGEQPQPGPSDGEIAGLSDEKFDDLLDEIERGARQPHAVPEAVWQDEPFTQLVRDALDELPAFVQDDLRTGNLVVLASNGGDEWDAFGLYMGGDVANDRWHRRILIFRDTLTRAFGADPDELRRQVAITVRHEVAHFYGADERRAHELGL